MKNTFTPLLINGEIKVYKNLPDSIHLNELAACEQYPILPQDTDYWKERIGKQMDEWDFSIQRNLHKVDNISYAIPKQTPQSNEEVWDEAWDKWINQLSEPIVTPSDLWHYLKQHYHLSPKQ